MHQDWNVFPQLWFAPVDGPFHFPAGGTNAPIGRDAARILHVATDVAGLKHLDHLITTKFDQRACRREVLLVTDGLCGHKRLSTGVVTD